MNLKNLCLGLALANLLLLAWYRWVAPAPAVDPAGRADGGPRLVAMAREGDSGPAAGGRLCQRVGPFPERDSAEQAGERLESDGHLVDYEAEEGEVWMGYWVQLEELAGAAAAREALSRLAQAGMSDAYIVGDAAAPRISLGVFRNRDAAEEIAARARDQGLRPEITDRTRPGTEHWLRVEVAAGGRLDLGTLQAPAARILRAENVGCAGSPPE